MDGIGEVYSVYINESVDFILQLLQQSTNCTLLKLSITLFRDSHPDCLVPLRKTSIRAISFLHQISQIMPRAELHLEPIFNENYPYDERKIYIPPSIELEGWIMEDVLKPSLLGNISVFTPDLEGYVSPALFTYLTNTKRLIVKGGYRKNIDLPGLESAILSMLSLKELETWRFMLSRIPEEVISLSSLKLKDEVTFSVNFWEKMASLTNLIDLHLHFRCPDMTRRNVASVIICINTLGNFNQLRSFEQEGSFNKVVDYFSKRLVTEASLLEDLRLDRIRVTDVTLDRIATRSLTRLRLALPQESVLRWPRSTVVKESRKIHWSTFSSFLARNPCLREVTVDFSYAYIRVDVTNLLFIVSVCPHLRKICFDLVHATLTGDSRTAVDLTLIYTHSEENRETDELMKQAITTRYDSVYLVLDLDVFRGVRTSPATTTIEC